MSEVLPGEKDNTQVLQNTAPPSSYSCSLCSCLPHSLKASSLLLLQGSPGKLPLVGWRCEKRKSWSVSAGSLRECEFWAVLGSVSAGSLGECEFWAGFWRYLTKSLNLFTKIRKMVICPPRWLVCYSGLNLLMSEQMLKEPNGQMRCCGSYAPSLHLTEWSQQFPHGRAAHAPERHRDSGSKGQQAGQLHMGPDVPRETDVPLDFAQGWAHWIPGALCGHCQSCPVATHNWPLKCCALVTKEDCAWLLPLDKGSQ